MCGLTLNTARRGASIVVFDPFYQPFKSQLLGAKCGFKHEYFQMFDLNLNKYE